MFHNIHQSIWSSKIKINSPKDVYRYLYPGMREQKKEFFVELCLDTKNQVLRRDIISIGSLNANFAFWSITGGTNGALASTANTPPPVNVGNTDIVAKASYISGGGGPGEIGVLIDAFDVGLGDFVDDDFVTVVPDGSLTAGGKQRWLRAYSIAGGY